MGPVYLSQLERLLLSAIERIIRLLIYLSAVMGIVLLPQLYGLVPSWLFYSVFVGWMAYVVVALLAWKGRMVAYPLAFILAILTLAVSLPQPEHYSYVQAGFSLASITFLIGSALQIALIILVPLSFYRNKTKRS